MEETPTATPISEEPSEIPKEPSRNWPKILGLALLGLVLASGIFAAGYFTALKTQPAKVAPLPTPTPQPISQATPTSTPTPDLTVYWKSYKNSELHYKVKYPQDFSSEILSDRSTWAGFAEDRLSWAEFEPPKKEGEWSYSLVIEVLESRYRNLDEWVAEMNAPSALGTGLYSVTDVKVAGLEAKQLSTSAEGGAIRTGLIYDSKLYVIHLIGAEWGSELENRRVIYNLFLQSFSFLK